MNYFCTVVIRQGQEPSPGFALGIVIAASELYAWGPIFGIAFLIVKVLSEIGPVINDFKVIVIVQDVLYCQICCLSLALWKCVYSQTVRDGNKARFKLCLTALLIFWVLRTALLSYWLYQSSIGDGEIDGSLVDRLCCPMALVFECCGGTVFLCIAAHYYRRHMSVTLANVGTQTQEMPPAVIPIPYNKM